MRQKPYCFKVGGECPHDIAQDPKLVFVLMPFEPEFDAVYQQGVKPAIEGDSVCMLCLRADEIFHVHDIMCQICQNIRRARFVVVDMTGRNPNVFYELGLAHAFAKEVVLLTQSEEDVPFDLRPMRFVTYSLGAGGLEDLSTQLRRTVEGLLAPVASMAAAGSSKLPTSTISPKDGAQMILIPAGEFIMGSKVGDESEQPQRQLYLPDFYIARYVVTNAQFEAFVEDTGHRTVAEKEGAGSDWRHPSGPGSHVAGKERHPVVQVSWDDALAYAQWAGKRLPMEPEWEKAARGTDGRMWPWGNDWVDGKCNTSEAGIDDTTPVGRYSPAADSPYGLADMAGNVWQWTADWYKAYPGAKCKSDAFGEKTKAVRGGAWYLPSHAARCAFRGGYPPVHHRHYLGFRIAE